MAGNTIQTEARYTDIAHSCQRCDTDDNAGCCVAFRAQLDPECAKAFVVVRDRLPASRDRRPRFPEEPPQVRRVLCSALRAGVEFDRIPGWILSAIPRRFLNHSRHRRTRRRRPDRSPVRQFSIRHALGRFCGSCQERYALPARQAVQQRASDSNARGSILAGFPPQPACACSHPSAVCSGRVADPS